MTNEFPPKPTRKEDFDKPVSWLVGRDLIAGLKWFALFAAFKGKIDSRDWMTPNCYPARKDLDALPNGNRKNSTAYGPAEELDDVLKFWQQKSDAAWDWKVDNDTDWEKLNQTNPQFLKRLNAEEFWFDYIADSGDGQMGTYGVAYLCLSDIWMKPVIASANVSSAIGSEVSFQRKGEYTKLLPRGSFLFVGGDTAYHIADVNSLRVRFQEPFRWAFSSIRNWLDNEKRLKTKPDSEGHLPLRDDYGRVWKSDWEPTRPIFGVPGNHDYYDVIHGFNLQFRAPAVPEHTRKTKRPHLSLLGFERQQNASYMAIQLPFGWWFWGLDTEVSQLDERQEEFFKKLNYKKLPDKLILATPEPTTVFRQRKPKDDKTLQAYEQLKVEPPPDGPPFQAPTKKGQCRLDLSGDVHHYARYFGPVKTDPKLPNSDHYASVVSGGGGAFMHPSQTHLSGDNAVKEQVLYPEANLSRKTFANPLFDLRNIFHGGYVWLFGMVIAFVIYFALTVPESSKDFMQWVAAGLHIPFTQEDKLPGLPSTGFTGTMALKGFIPSTFELILAMCGLGTGIYLLYRITKKLEAAPREYASDLIETAGDSTDDPAPVATEESTETAAAKAPTLPVEGTYRNLWRCWLCVGLGLILYAVGVIICERSAPKLHPFGSSLLVLIHVIVAVELIVLSIQFSAWLANRAEFVRQRKFAYAPIWLFSGLGFALLFFGVWMFGRYPGAYVLSDSIFALVLVGVWGALTFLGASKGGELQPFAGKLFMGIVGFFHGALQLLAPLFLIRIGDWRAVVSALVIILLLSGWTLPGKEKGWPGIGALLMKLPQKGSKIGLTLVWFVYGGLLLALPLWLHDQRGSLRSDGLTTSFLPPLVVNFMHTQVGLGRVSLAVISICAAVGMGFLLSLSLLSWYFAVALAFQGHNNEVGGAGRVEKFRHILRICVTQDKITVYGIGFDEPNVDGVKLEPRIIDAFELTPAL